MVIYDFVAPLKKLVKVSQSELSNVACFFIKNGAIISSGINHNPAGGPMETEIDGKLVSLPEVVHAEIAAIEAAKKNKIDLTGSILLLNISPCIKCAKEVAKTGITDLYFLYEWWDKAALKFLVEHNIKVHKIKELK